MMNRIIARFAVWIYLRYAAPAPAAVEPEQEPRRPLARAGAWSTDALATGYSRESLLSAVNRLTFQKTPEDFTAVGGFAMDSMDGCKSTFSLGHTGVSDMQLAYFGSQGFIGYQACAMLAQNWLISKACNVPARDAIRNGWDLKPTDDTTPPETIAQLREFDKRYGVVENLREFVTKGRIFGIRIAMFDVLSTDPEYYEKPYNPDGVTPRSYKGITQIDPYWITPELDGAAVSDPSSRHFYEPTWWRVNGKRIHRTHLVIMRGDDVPDILKPTYIYGGISVPQKIYERVYASERTANEAPQLALTKRTKVRKVDLQKAAANPSAFEQKLRDQAYYQDNYGTLVADLDETFEQHDTALSDLDAVIMTQYQLVAAAANIPVTKLLGTTPKGFNATGEYDEATYHEDLASLQAHDLTKLLDRHYELLIRSELRVEPFAVVVDWKPLDELTTKEQAEVNKLKAETGEVLVRSGAIDGADERARVTADPASGYAGLEATVDEEPPPEDDVGADSEPLAPTNAAMRDLSGKQFQGVARIIRNHAKGTLATTQAAVMLKSGFGLSDGEVQQLLVGVESDA